jgi:hypothetical protein
VAIAYDRDGDLPEGIHELSIEEFWARYAYNAWRGALLALFEWALGVLKKAGVRRVYVGGSFVTNRESPGDIDACWDLDPQVDVARTPQGFPEGAGPAGWRLHLFSDAPQTHFLRDLLSRKRGSAKRVGIVLLSLDKSHSLPRRQARGSVDDD